VVNAGHKYLRYKAIDGQHGKGEKDFVAQVRDSESVQRRM